MSDCVRLWNQAYDMYVSGFLLREINDFWRVALLISTLLYKIDSTENLLNKNCQLDELRDLFKAAESSIVGLGKALFK